MYEVSIVTVDRKFEKYRCKTIDEVLKLFDKLDDDEISLVTIKKLEEK